ncbi:hypothetical protein M0R45_037449 [Rubus argutus]|uniref:Cucumisin n=1 Tax=Rubus argutus TaxID=59490 RepID=A0AAW1W2Y7_RUBAR
MASPSQPSFAVLCCLLMLLTRLLRCPKGLYCVYGRQAKERGSPITSSFEHATGRSSQQKYRRFEHEALLLHSYKRSFNGFAAMLTEQEAQKMAGNGWCSVCFPSKQSKIKTTKSWNFLGFPETVKRSKLERDIIVGVIDTGIWPESYSFSDAGFSPPPKKWKGKCQGNGNLTCNNKLIGARYYRASRSFEDDVESPRDSNGHGTHCASTAAGNLLSVAATTINRQFITKVQLGNGKIYEGLLPNIHDLKGKFYPLIYGGDAPNTKNGADASISRFCFRNSIDANLIKAADEVLGLPPVSASYVSLEENRNIYKYINSTRNPTATIWKSEEINDVLAPYVPSYSSRGPNSAIPNILKPDLAAPGTYILAAVPPIDGGRLGGYNFKTGTSMACPHATAVAAYVKSFHPKWSPAAIQSALITTAKPMSTRVNPEAEFAYGAGLINPSRAPYPGLVYDLNEQDYINFLCSQGYSGKLLQTLTRDKTSCPKSNNGKVNDLNYPSFALSIKDPKFINGVFHRTVTNVGSSNSTYKAKVAASLGLKISVNPSVLSFTALGQKKSFTVTIAGPIEKSSLASASLVWDDGVFQVRSPIIVYVGI